MIILQSLLLSLLFFHFFLFTYLFSLRKLTASKQSNHEVMFKVLKENSGI